jgi:NAD(P)H-hydrate epimerase
MTRDQVRKYDADAIARGVPGIVLMENAGRGVADWMEEIGVRGPVAVVCGKGNNGGDGFVIARQLQSRGYDVRVAMLVHPVELTGDAATAWAAFQGLPVPRTSTAGDAAGLSKVLDGCDWIVDAILGTGLIGAAREPYASAIRAVNAFERGVKVMAVDLPSGLNCDSGVPNDPTIKATYTATFVAEKVGFASASAKPFLGEVRVFDIGAGLVDSWHVPSRLA